MGSYNIVGDLAGRFDELQLLLKQVPEGELIFVGDLVDRGPKSAELVNYMVANKVRGVQGNHEHMMIDAIEDTGYYEEGIWFMNGGLATAKSYFRWRGEALPEATEELSQNRMIFKRFKEIFPAAHLEYLKALPPYLKLEGWAAEQYVVTHAPINPVWGLEKAAKNILDLNADGTYRRADMWYTPAHDMSVIWNRGTPKRIPGVDLQIHGHNAMRDMRYFADQHGRFAVDIDTSKDKKITILNLPGGSSYEQEYLEDAQL